MKKIYLETPEAVIKALKEGKEVRDKYGSICKLVDGIIISKLNDFFEIGKPIRSVNKPYILGEEPFKIEVGKFYKTRDGRKAWITEYRDTEDVFPFLVAAQKELALYSVTKEGRFYSEGISGTDLVAPWEE